MSILCIDYMNIAHRARSGFASGDHAVTYNFFRQVKSLIDQFKPTRVIFALEGRPIARHESLDNYKANRKIESDDPRYAELVSFHRQSDEIIDLLVQYFPVSVVRHPTSEADDTIANLIKRSSSAVEWVVVSSDSDFTQLLQDHDNVRLYNPVRKEFVAPPADYDYVTWKALRGDACDNIPGIPGVGDKTASKIASDPVKLQEYVSRSDVKPIFERNYNLIRFTTWSEEDREKMTSSSPVKNWDDVRNFFSMVGFNSITKDGSWEKFIKSFDSLWTNPAI